MNSPLQKPALKATPSRNGFDLTASDKFTTPFGVLLPVRCWDMMPNSYIEIRNETEVIGINPLIRPTGMRLKQHIDYFAVPIVQLWSYYDNFITGQDNLQSSALVDSKPSAGQEYEVPCFGGDFLAQLFHVLSGYKDINGYPADYNAARLLDQLGYGGYFYELVKHSKFGHFDPSNPNWLTEANTYLNDGNTLPMNFLRLAAYQKIYYSYYRNSAYEANNVHAYNIDWMNAWQLFGDVDFTSKYPVTISESNKVKSLFELHYRMLNKDYFMQVSPSILPSSDDFGFQNLWDAIGETPSEKFETSSVFSLFSLPGIPGASQSDSVLNVVNTDNSLISPHEQGSSVNLGYSSSNTQINTSALRFAFAYDKLLRRMRSAGATFDKQMLAQFGIKPYDGRHGDAFFLGGFTNRITVNNVTATSDGDSELGTLAGQIDFYADNTKSKIKYHANEDCIVMAIYSYSLDNEYNSFNTERSNLRRFRFDFFNPAFENVGKQAIYNIELNNISDQEAPITPAEFSPAGRQTLTKVLGFVPRYSEYKLPINRIHGLLQWPFGNASFMPYTTQYNVFEHDEGDTFLRTFPLHHDVMVCNPNMVDHVVSQSYTGYPDSDLFVVFMINHVKFIAPMSVNGEVF